MAIVEGTHIGPYVVVGRLGAGGMGVVYRATDTRLRRDVALKALQTSPDAAGDGGARLLAEARAAATLHHPNICVVHDVGEHDSQVFVAMEYVEGSTLDGVIARGRLSWEQIVDIGIQIADAIAHAHRAGVIHRDLKGANVMVAPDGRVKVLDFGLALRPADRLTEATQSRDAADSRIAGTLAYMAPEVLRGDDPATASVDIWSLGVVLHHMAAAERPFAGLTGFDLSSAILRDPPRPLPANVPLPLAAVIRRCLTKDPVKRYTSMDEVRAALEVAAQPERAQGSTPPRASSRSSKVWRLAAVAAIAVATVAAVMIWRGRRAPAAPVATARVERLAVLPFENLSGDPGQSFFSDGMTDEITTSLARTGSVTVISRTSAMVFKDHTTPLAEIGQRLNVQAVVEGSVLRSGELVRVSVRLVDVASDRHLWADRFERNYRDILALQSDVARAVVQHVRAELAPDDTTRPPPTQVNPAAYEKYLLGRHLVQQRNAESATRSIEYLQQAAALDPRSAIIQAALAVAYREHDTWAGVGIGSSAEKIRAAAARAIALDGQLPEAHFALAQLLYWYDWDWPGAAREFQTALTANPSLADAHMGQALLLQTLGQDEAAVQAARRATALEPLAPTYLSDYGRILYRARRYPEAIEALTTALQLDASFVPALYRIADTQLMLDNMTGYRRTLARIESAGAKVPSQNLRTLRAMALAHEGHPAEARALARQIDAASRGSSPGEYAFPLATIYAQLGDASASLDWLETGIGKRAMYPLQLRDPQLTLVQREPRYQELLRRLGMSAVK